VCADLLGLRAQLVAQVRERAAALCDIKPDHILVCCSHTHWGPEVMGDEYLPKLLRDNVSAEYREELIAKLAGLVAQADGARVAAVAAWGSGFAHDISFNRRQVGLDFKTDMHLVLDPEPAALASEIGNELALAWEPGEHMGPRLSEPIEELGDNRVGPADAEVPVLRLDKSDGTPLATLVNFACHAVCGGDDFYGYSADYVGYAREAFAAVIGCPMLFADGCAGRPGAALAPERLPPACRQVPGGGGRQGVAGPGRPRGRGEAGGHEAGCASAAQPDHRPTRRGAGRHRQPSQSRKR